jgi:hypothetical protein
MEAERVDRIPLTGVPELIARGEVSASFTMPALLYL